MERALGIDPGAAGLGGSTSFQPVNVNELLARAYGNGNQTSAYGAVGQDKMVWMGPGYAQPGTPGKRGSQGTPANPGNMSIADAQKLVWRFTPEERALWEEYNLVDNGYIPGDAAAEGLWQNVLEGLAAQQAAMGEEGRMDPWEYMQMKIQRRRETEAAKGGGGGGSSTRSIVNLTNKQDATVLVDQALSESLGRRATSKEVNKFLSVLNKVERSNPTVVSASGQSGGSNPQLVAQEFAQSREGAAEFTASSSYMDWMMESLTKDPLMGIKSGL